MRVDGSHAYDYIMNNITGIATMGPRGVMAPSLLSCFGAVSMSWFTFAIASILCCGPLTCLLLATSLHNMNVCVRMYSVLYRLFCDIQSETD